MNIKMKERYNMMNRMTSFKTILTFLLLTIGATGAKAADYVLAYVNGNTYYVARNGTTGVQREATFDPATCVWSCSSNTAGTMDGTLTNSNEYGYLYQMVGNTRYFLSANGNNLALETTANDYCRWRTNGTYVYNYYSRRYSYYINLANGVARNTTANTASNARPYEVTTTPVAATLTGVTIATGEETLSATGSYSYTLSTGTFTSATTNYRFNDQDHYSPAQTT